MLWLLAMCLGGMTAQAEEMTLSWQGRLVDSLGSPIDGGSHAVTLSLWSSETSTNVADRLHLEPFTGMAPSDGYLVVTLGSGEVLDSGVFAKPQVWLEASVDGSVMGARSLLTSVPRAAVSTHTQRFLPSTAACDGSNPADVGLVRFTGAALETPFRPTVTWTTADGLSWLELLMRADRLTTTRLPSGCPAHRRYSRTTSARRSSLTVESTRSAPRVPTREPRRTG